MNAYESFMYDIWFILWYSLSVYDIWFILWYSLSVQTAPLMALTSGRNKLNSLWSLYTQTNDDYYISCIIEFNFAHTCMYIFISSSMCIIYCSTGRMSLWYGTQMIMEEYKVLNLCQKSCGFQIYVYMTRKLIHS